MTMLDIMESEDSKEDDKMKYKVCTMDFPRGGWFATKLYDIIEADSVEEVMNKVYQKQEYRKGFYADKFFTLVAHIEDENGNVVYTIGDFGIKSLQRFKEKAVDN